MEDEIKNLIDSGWGHAEVMQEASVRGWNKAEAEKILARELVADVSDASN